jgi:hypothetical protein
MIMHISTKQMEKLMDGYVQMIKEVDKTDLAKSIDKGIEDYFDDQERKDNLLIEVGELRAENKRLKDEIARLQGFRPATDDSNIKFGDE